MRGLRVIWTVAVIAAGWAGAGPASAHHSAGGLYTGTISGAGLQAMVEFEVSPDGSAVTRFKTLNVVVSPCQFSDTEMVGSFPINGHAFASQSAEVSFTGKFDAVQKASGTVTLTPPTVAPNPPCNSGPLNWTATTTAAAPPQCQDGGDNDGDGKADHPADPGCAAPADTDEADPPDTTPPVLTLQVAGTQRASGNVQARASCGAEACRAQAEGVVSISGSSKRYRLKAVSGDAAAGQSARLALKPSKATRAAIRRALRAKRKVRVKLTVTATDAAGNRVQATRTIRLRG